MLCPAYMHAVQSMAISLTVGIHAPGVNTVLPFSGLWGVTRTYTYVQPLYAARVTHALTHQLVPAGTFSTSLTVKQLLLPPAAVWHVCSKSALRQHVAAAPRQDAWCRKQANPLEQHILGNPYGAHVHRTFRCMVQQGSHASTKPLCLPHAQAAALAQ
jgi:hypothetical protein